MVYEGTNPDTGQPIIKAFLNPLVGWIWAGLVVIVFGTFVALVPSLTPATAALRVPGGTSRARRAGAEGRRLMRRVSRAFQLPCTFLMVQGRTGRGSGRGRLLLGGRHRRRLRAVQPGPPPDVHLRLRGDARANATTSAARSPRRSSLNCAPTSPPARATSRSLDAFVAKYGATVLAAPTTQGFDLVAWIAPFAVFAAALLGTILLVRRWSVGRAAVPVTDPAALDPEERRRLEKIRRETGMRWRVLSHDNPAGRIAGIFLTLALLVYTFWPENVFASQRQKTRLDYLLERKEQLYENLRDLNFEYRAGKYPEEDFVVQRAQLENETAQLLAEIECLQQA